MQAYWITFTDGSKGCVEGQSSYDAVRIAEHVSGKTVKLPEGGNKWQPDIPTLPYPASPAIWQFDHPCHGKTPTFCHKPEQCKGRSACPQNYSCTE